MATDTVVVRNTLNGQLANVQRNILSNTHLMKHLVVVERENPKPQVLLTPSTAEEYQARRGSYEESRAKPANLGDPEEAADTSFEDTDTTEEG